MVTRPLAEQGHGQVFHMSDAFGTIRDVLSRSRSHDRLLPLATKPNPGEPITAMKSRRTHFPCYSLEILLTFIATLPERQRIVAQCFIDNFEDFRERDTYRPLADAVSAITGTTESVAAVKNVWRYAREKIIVELQRRGYTYMRVE
jgi:hypothetical protein